jgi:hypothetical protein
VAAIQDGTIQRRHCHFSISLKAASVAVINKDAMQD